MNAIICHRRIFIKSAFGKHLDQNKLKAYLANFGNVLACITQSSYGCATFASDHAGKTAVATQNHSMNGHLLRISFYESIFSHPK